MNLPLSRFVCLATVLCALSCAPDVTAGESLVPNLIPNGDLKQVTTIQADGLPIGMTTWSSIPDRPTAKCYLLQDQKSPKLNSMCIERLDSPKGVTRVVVSKPIPVEAGKRFYFSCNIKSTKGQPAVFIFVLNGAKKELPFGLPDVATTTLGATLAHSGSMIQLQRGLLANPDAFNKVELTFTVPPAGCFLSIVVDFSWNALGKAWFNDFQLLPLDRSSSEGTTEGAAVVH